MPIRENKLPRIYSLKSRIEIDHLFDKGRRIFTDYFILIWEETSQFKFGVFVSGKIKKAVERNRIKRIFREAIRQNREKLDKNYRIGILPKKTDKIVRFDVINAEISRIFSKLNSVE
ncbi:MAG: ribonuclease P protein component [candidate division Zixibacteria bacterium]|nr:ribonuclease P protein component [candidate division Zixibacteria bacterium]